MNYPFSFGIASALALLLSRPDSRTARNCFHEDVAKYLEESVSVDEQLSLICQVSASPSVLLMMRVDSEKS